MFLITAVSTAKKASEERLTRLQKSVDLYKDRLGLEIRKIYGKYINISNLGVRNMCLSHFQVK